MPIEPAILAGYGIPWLRALGVSAAKSPLPRRQAARVLPQKSRRLLLNLAWRISALSQKRDDRPPSVERKPESLTALAGMISLIVTVLGGLSLILGLIVIDRFRSRSDPQASVPRTEFGR